LLPCRSRQHIEVGTYSEEEDVQLKTNEKTSETLKEFAALQFHTPYFHCSFFVDIEGRIITHWRLEVVQHCCGMIPGSGQ